MTLLSCTLLTLAIWALAVQVLGQLAVFWLVRKPSLKCATPSSGVTVLKPLKGADPNLEQNLRSMFEQDWHQFELVFGAEDPFDPALAVVHRLAREYPHIPCRVVTSPKPLGLNPKVRLCAELARHARFDLVLISDASVFAPPGYLRAMVDSYARPNTGLVSSPLVGFGETTPGGSVDNLILNLFILRAVCFTKLFIRHSCVIGKSMMFRLSELNRLGGWQSVRDVLAEDYVLGRLFRRAGFEVRLCPLRLPTRTHCSAVGDSLRRHVRWCQMRRRTSMMAYLAELLANATLWAGALIGVASFSDSASVPTEEGSAQAFVMAGLIILGAKLLLDVGSMVWLSPGGTYRRALRWLLIADVLNVWIWLQGAVRRRVEWRGTQLLIGDGTRLTLYDRAESTDSVRHYSAANS